MIDNNLHEAAYRGKDYQIKLTMYRLAVCGVGALGSNLVDTLARVGFSNIKVIDFDRVNGQNVGTQCYGMGDVGALKAHALASRIFRDTGVEIETVHKKLDEGNSKKLLRGSTLVVDCFDNIESRELVWTTCSQWNMVSLRAGLSNDGYGQVSWNVTKLPTGEYVTWNSPRHKGFQQPTGDPCEVPLARNAILMTVAILAEEILDYCLADKPRFKSWSLTLKDLAIREIK